MAIVKNYDDAIKDIKNILKGNIDKVRRLYFNNPFRLGTLLITECNLENRVNNIRHFYNYHNINTSGLSDAMVFEKYVRQIEYAAEQLIKG